MEVSEIRLAANRANAKRAKGPVTERGKSISRRNSLKHGLTGAGVVLPEGDQAEVESRFESLHEEMQPRSALGSILIRKIATLSVRSERSAEQENAAIAGRVRDAVLVFDEERACRVDELYEALQDNPRAALRNLRRMPEGVDRLIEGWRNLRRELDYEGAHRWGSPQLARAANLSGVLHLDAHGTRIGDLSNAIWGEFHGLTAREGGDLDDEARRQWARVALLELIDARIAELEAHRTTLDFDRIEQDRLEAPALARFDDSQEARLARRYEADADRGFYKALKEFRLVEAEAAARVEPSPEVPIPDRPDPRMGSFREPPLPAARERALALLNDLEDEETTARGSEKPPLSPARTLSPPE